MTHGKTSFTPGTPLPDHWFHILLALADDNRHGLGIIQEVTAQTDGHIQIWPGMLYLALKRMTDDGLVAETEPPVGFVVGVVADVREGGLAEQPKAAIYISRAQWPHSDIHIIVRTSRATSEMMKLVRASVADLDGALPVIDVRSADDIVAAGARPQQLTGSVIGAFAVSGLVLAAIGLYGLISYSVAQRRQELGVRAAIGARPRDLI